MKRSCFFDSYRFPTLIEQSYIVYGYYEFCI